MNIELNNGDSVERVNTETGEVLNKWDEVYCATEYKHSISASEREYYRDTSKCPMTAKHVDEVKDYLKWMHDGRVPMVTINNSRKIFNEDSGNARLNNSGITFTKPQYKLLNRIADNLTYRNMLIGSVDDVCSTLDISPKKLKEAFRKLEGQANIYTSRDGMLKGQVRIIIAPWYGFKYPYSEIGKAYHEACNSWMRAKAV